MRRETGGRTFGASRHRTGSDEDGEERAKPNTITHLGIPSLLWGCSALKARRLAAAEGAAPDRLVRSSAACYASAGRPMTWSAASRSARAARSCSARSSSTANRTTASAPMTSTTRAGPASSPTSAGRSCLPPVQGRAAPVPRQHLRHDGRGTGGGDPGRAPRSLAGRRLHAPTASQTGELHVHIPAPAARPAFCGASDQIEQRRTGAIEAPGLQPKASANSGALARTLLMRATASRGSTVSPLRNPENCWA